MFLKPIEGLKEWKDVVIISLLSRREADFVDTVVDSVVNPVVHLLDLRLKMGWKEAYLSLCAFSAVFREKAIESRIKHANDFARLVVDNCFCAG